ncbi:hypothetical protein SARC_16713, partial [Sphaeroforma arctica JP610]
RPQLLSNANHPAYYLPELMRKLDLMGNPKARCLVQQKPEVTLSFFPPLPPTGASAYEGHDDLQRTLTVDVIRFATIPPTKVSFLLNLYVQYMQRWYGRGSMCPSVRMLFNV